MREKKRDMNLLRTGQRLENALIVFFCKKSDCLFSKAHPIFEMNGKRNQLH